jgi:hypothetical protein
MNDYQAAKEFRNETELLRRDNPEMDEDEILFAHMVEGCTDFTERVHRCLRYYFAAKKLQEANEQHFGRKLHYWKSRIKELRTIAHFSEKQQFPEGTIYESKPSDKVIYDYNQVSERFKKVDESALRKALNDGEQVPSASLLPNNEAPNLNIRTK